MQCDAMHALLTALVLSCLVSVRPYLERGDVSRGEVDGAQEGVAGVADKGAVALCVHGQPPWFPELGGGACVCVLVCVFWGVCVLCWGVCVCILVCVVWCVYVNV